MKSTLPNCFVIFSRHTPRLRHERLWRHLTAVGAIAVASLSWTAYAPQFIDSHLVGVNTTYANINMNDANSHAINVQPRKRDAMRHAIDASLTMNLSSATKLATKEAESEKGVQALAVQPQSVNAAVIAKVIPISHRFESHRVNAFSRAADADGEACMARCADGRYVY